MQDVAERLTLFEEDVKWIGDHYEALVKKYAKQYVAVLDKQVVDHGKNLNQIVRRLTEKYKEEYPRIAVEYISPEKVEMIL